MTISPVRAIGIRILAATLLGLLTQAAQAADAGNAQACQLKVYETLDFRTLPDGSISIPVRFQDRDLYFLVDTGGIANTVDPDIVERLQLRQIRSAVKFYGVRGAILDHYVETDNFSIGALSSKNLLFMVEPASWRGLSGTVAPVILGAYDVDFDFAGGKFRLISPDHCPGQVVYWTSTAPYATVPLRIEDDRAHISIPILVDGKEIRAQLDTGAAMSFMSLRAAHRYLDFNEKDPNVKVIGTGEHQSYVYPFKTLSFEGIAVRNPYIVIMPDSDMRLMGPDMILGVGILRQLHVYIAYKERKIYLTAATAH